MLHSIIQTLTLIGGTANNKTYDATTTATLSLGSATLSGVIPTDTGNVNVNVSGYSAFFNNQNANTNISVTGTNLIIGSAIGNYVVANPGFSATINPAGLAIAANSSTKVAGTADPVFTYNVSGLVGGNISSQILSGDLSRQAGQAPGNYPITIGSLISISSNYLISTFTGNTFTITPAQNVEPVTPPINVVEQAIKLPTIIYPEQFMEGSASYYNNIMTTSMGSLQLEVQKQNPAAGCVNLGSGIQVCSQAVSQ